MTTMRHAPAAPVREPGSVRVAFWLWVTGLVLTVPVVLLSRFGAPERGANPVGSLMLLALAIWALLRFATGRPLARAALCGFAGFCVLGTTFDLIVLNALPEWDPLLTLHVWAGGSRAAFLVVAAVLSYTGSACDYFGTAPPRTAPAASRSAVTAWGVAIAAVAGQLLIAFSVLLPSGGPTWLDWAVLNAEDTLQAALGLCLLPAWCSVLWQFRLGSRWALVTLVVLGTLVGIGEGYVLGTLDGLAPVLAAVHLTATVAAVVLSWRRRTRS
ncbi:hypothetical protein [Prauserella flavalba]|uniref:hypothetical protein n=1 Tax=Prauserella flavalba TaxID=1477506 RepID=UPI0036E21723